MTPTLSPNSASLSHWVASATSLIFTVSPAPAKCHPRPFSWGQQSFPHTPVPPGPSWSLCPGPQLPVPQVITAQQLPKLNRDKGSSIVDPFVRVEIYGIPADCAKQQTHHKLNNGECWHLGTPKDIPGPMGTLQGTPIPRDIPLSITPYSPFTP